MKSKIYKTAVLVLLTVLVGSVFFFGWSQYVEAASRRALHTVSEHAKDITAVEVLSINGASETGVAGSYLLPNGQTSYAITRRQILTGEQAANLVRSWGHVRFMEGGHAACHEPGFALRFLEGQRKIFEVAICFDCENVSYKPAPFASAYIQMSSTAFDPKSGIDELKLLLTSLK